MTRVAGMVVLSLLGGCWPLHAQASGGPRRGSLVLTGGEFGTGVIERFAALAGGAGASVVYIPSASSGIKLPSGFTWVPPELPDATNNNSDFQQELSKLFGLRVTVLHSRDRAVWDSDSLGNVLRRADAVWISGGNAGRLASLVLGTRSERALRDLLERGRVIGGNSAGAIIAGRGWENLRTVVHVISPVPFPVIAYAAAWTPGTDRAVTGLAMLVQIDSAAEKYRGKLRGAIVLEDPLCEVRPAFAGPVLAGCTRSSPKWRSPPQPETSTRECRVKSREGIRPWEFLEGTGA